MLPICGFSSSSVLSSDQQTTSSAQPHKKRNYMQYDRDFRKAIFVLDAQSTDQKNGCQP